MSEPVTPPAPPDGGAVTPPPVAAVPPAAPVAPPAPFVVSKDEWVESRREQRQIRELLSKLTPAAATTTPATVPTAPPDAMAAVEELRQEIALRDAFDAHKVAAGNPLRELIATAAKASKPPDLAAFVGKYAGAAAATPAPAVVTPPAAPSNTGTPAATPAQASLPADPRHWPRETVAAMTTEAWRAELEKYEASQGRRNPLAHLRRR
jgi:hypothetical protein